MMTTTPNAVNKDADLDDTAKPALLEKGWHALLGMCEMLLSFCSNVSNMMHVIENCCRHKNVVIHFNPVSAISCVGHTKILFPQHHHALY